MKIISKYKDFYDYMTQDHDADITYVRNMNVVNLENHNINRIIYNSNKYYPYIHYTSFSTIGCIQLNNYLFGIYPYVYTQPFLRVCHRASWGTTYTNIVLSKDIIDGILSDDKEIFNNTINTIKKKCQEIVDENNLGGERHLVYYRGKYATFEKNLRDDIRKYVNKVEYKDIFYEMNSPVFVEYNSELFEGTVYEKDLPITKVKNSGYSGDSYYITNISFQKLKENILKYWFDELNNISTYINMARCTGSGP